MRTPGLPVDRGVLYGSARGCRCGVCLNVRVRARPRSREEGKAEGWRYHSVWGWLCPTCGLGSPGLFTQERKRRMRPGRVRRWEEHANPLERRPRDRSPEEVRNDRWGTPRKHGAPSKLGDVLRDVLSRDPEP